MRGARFGDDIVKQVSRLYVSGFGNCGTLYPTPVAFGWGTGNSSIAVALGGGDVEAVGTGSTFVLAGVLITTDFETSCDCYEDTRYPVAEVQVVLCPSAVSVSSSTPLDLEAQFPDLKTGIGVVTAMQVHPLQINFTGTQIVETVSESSRTCPASLGNVCFGNSTFTVGQGGFRFGQFFPGNWNVFYDEHSTYGGASYLHAEGIESCQAVCDQKYYCAGMQIGNFTITRTLTRGTIQSTPVSHVTVTKE